MKHVKAKIKMNTNMKMTAKGDDYIVHDQFEEDEYEDEEKYQEEYEDNKYEPILPPGAARNNMDHKKRIRITKLCSHQDSIDKVSGLSSKSLQWLLIRLGCFTGSVVAEFIGHEFGSVEKAIKDFVFGKDYESVSAFTKKIMPWGSYCEDQARGVLLYQFKREHQNSIVLNISFFVHLNLFIQKI
jgi:hypothetical protein